MTGKTANPSQATTAAKPTLLQGDIGTQKAAKFLRFDGDDALVVSAASYTHSGLSIYALMRSVPGGASGFLNLIDLSGVAQLAVNRDASAGIILYLYSNRAGGSNYANDGRFIAHNQWFIVKIIFDGATIKLTQHEATRVFNAAPISRPASLPYVTSNPINIAPGGCPLDIRGLVIDFAVHTAEQQQKIENYFRNRYGFAY